MPASRNQNHGGGPERVPSFGHQFEDLHTRVIDNDAKDENFYSGIAHRAKVDFICGVLKFPRASFNLDIPFPLEDWAHSDDYSLITCGLYMATMRNEFYTRLFESNPELKRGSAWLNHSEAEHWNHEFNVLVHRRAHGILIHDPRVKH